MKHILLIFILIGTHFALSAQDEEVYTVVERMPRYKGGNAAMMEYLKTNIKYPQKARDANISGRVFLEVIIAKDSTITDVKVIRRVGMGCDDEAIRVVKSMPDWISGKQGGESVNVKYVIPVNFSLE